MREVINNKTNLQILKIKLESIIQSSELYHSFTEDEKRKFQQLISEIFN